MKIPLGNPFFDGEMREAALNALQNERFVLGASVFKFEEEFARYCGTKYAVSTNSGNAALQLSLLAPGIGHGDQVVTTPYSFVATANAALHVNATPVFADINLKTGNIDPEAMAKKITKDTKALIPVHILGFPAEMDSSMDSAKDKGVSVVEDACQAHGAEYFGRKVGCIGDVGGFSFYPSKNMTVCGDDGMVVTNNEEIAKKIAKLRDCGRSSHYEHGTIGFTARLNTMSAAIGRVQLRKLDEWMLGQTPRLFKLFVIEVGSLPDDCLVNGAFRIILKLLFEGAVDPHIDPPFDFSSDPLEFLCAEYESVDLRLPANVEWETLRREAGQFLKNNPWALDGTKQLVHDAMTELRTLSQQYKGLYEILNQHIASVDK